MIIGTGIDMIETKRMASKVIKGNHFKENAFSSAEIAYCESVANPYESYAARFAAKEAFLKATGHGLLLGIHLRDIEIMNNENGKPFVTLRGIFAEEAKKNNWNKIHVSLSHIKDLACAMVVIER